jgi:hypothetical protein
MLALERLGGCKPSLEAVELPALKLEYDHCDPAFAMQRILEILTQHHASTVPEITIFQRIRSLRREFDVTLQV